MAPTAARLHLLTTRTLPLILDRNRLLSSHPPRAVPPSLDTQIDAALSQLREGILQLEREGGVGETRELREGWERMRVIVGDGWGAGDLPPPPSAGGREEELVDTGSATPRETLFPLRNRERDLAIPFRDSPPSSPTFVPGAMLQTQRQIIEEQDTTLDHLSTSLRAQHDIGLQIGSELDIHTGLLEELDHDVDRTGGRLSVARRRLETVAKGARNNASAWSIVLIIFVLLILIIVFKT